MKNILDMEQYRVDLIKSKCHFKRLKRRLVLKKKKLIRKLKQKQAKLLELKCSPKDLRTFKAIVENRTSEEQDSEVDQLRERVAKAKEARDLWVEKVRRIQLLKSEAFTSVSLIALQCQDRKNQPAGGKNELNGAEN